MIGFDNISSTGALQAKVEVSTLAEPCTCKDYLQEFTISREGDMSKFFGFGICQKLSLSLMDLYRQLEISSNNTTRIYLGTEENFNCPYPTFYITEVNRDESNNSITCTAYDRLILASQHTFSELGITTPYTVRTVLEAIAGLLEVPLKIDSSLTIFDTVLDSANLEGTENLRTILDAIAEFTQTIYFINYEDNLTFKRMDKDGDPDFTITKDLYFELDTKTNRRLSAICNCTELGDNVEASTGETGTTQYIRNNPFLELRTDIGSLLDTAIAAVGGFTINQFRCDWDGNYSLELGDKIDLITEDNSSVTSYLLSDTITYDGTLNEVTEWTFTENNNETASNPSTLGEKLNQTYARVDKVNKEINLFVSEVDGLKGTTQTHTQQISSLQLNTESISASVSSLESTMKESDEALSGSIETLTKEVNLKMTSEDVDLAITETLENGVDKVTTQTGFTFNAEGLTVSKSDSDISTQITEDGMTIKRNYSEVLVANNQGVKAEDLHATTYLIIGDNSRFEDQGNRTACFWLSN